jgi:hypothetical protein
MSQNRTIQGTWRAVRGAGLELNVSSAVVCGLAAFALQTAALERAPFCAAPLEEAQASPDPDADGGCPVPSVAPRRGQTLLGCASPYGGPPASGVPLPGDAEIAEASASESALAAAALAAGRHLAALRPRGPPRLPA